MLPGGKRRFAVAFLAFIVLAVLVLYIRISYLWTSDQDDLKSANWQSNYADQVAVDGNPDAWPYLTPSWDKVVMHVDGPEKFYIGYQSGNDKVQYYRHAITPDNYGNFAMRIGPGDVVFVVRSIQGEPVPTLTIVSTAGDEELFEGVPTY